MRQRTHREKGATIIEASLVLMLFLVLVFSLFDFGFVLYFHHTLMHQARSAVRWGVVRDYDADAIRNMVIYDSPTAGPSPQGILGLTASNVTVQRQGADRMGEDRILVTISNFKYPLLTPGWAGLHAGKAISVSMPFENRE